MAVWCCRCNRSSADAKSRARRREIAASSRSCWHTRQLYSNQFPTIEKVQTPRHFVERAAFCPNHAFTVILSASAASSNSSCHQVALPALAQWRLWVVLR